MSESQLDYPLSQREKALFGMAGLVLEGLAVAEAANDELAGGAILSVVGLGHLAVARWGEFRSRESAEAFDALTGTRRDTTGTPI